jgi:hypothetical protein
MIVRSFSFPYVSLAAVLGAGLRPVNTVLPAISGTEQVGETLSVTDGTWLNTPTAYSYQWFYVDPLVDQGELVIWNGTPVYVGAKTNLGTANTQLIGAGQEDYLIGCDVTASNANGSNTAESETTDIITASSAYTDAYLTPPAAIVSTTTTYTFGNVTGIISDARTRIIIAASTNGGTAALHNSLTANTGAITFTKIAQSAGTANTNMLSLWEASVPSTTTLTAPVLTCSAAPARAVLRCWAHGRGASTDFIGVATNTGTIDVPASGLVIGAAHVTDAGSPTNTFTGLDVEDYDALASGAMFLSGGRYANSGGAETNRTITATWTSASNQRLVAAAFGAHV